MLSVLSVGSRWQHSLKVHLRTCAAHLCMSLYNPASFRHAGPHCVLAIAVSSFYIFKWEQNTSHQAHWAVLSCHVDAPPVITQSAAETLWQHICCASFSSPSPLFSPHLTSNQSFCSHHPDWYISTTNSIPQPDLLSDLTLNRSEPESKHHKHNVGVASFKTDHI